MAPPIHNIHTADIAQIAYKAGQLILDIRLLEQKNEIEQSTKASMGSVQNPNDIVDDFADPVRG